MPKERQLLLVDDDALIRESMGCTLRDLGYLVTLCMSGDEALQRAGIAGFDVFVTDYEMPGMKGTELVRRIRTLFPRSFIIGMSGYDLASEFLDAGSDRFLRKPVMPHALREVMAALPDDMP